MNLDNATSVLTGIYALLLLIGGMIGYFKGGSLISLLAGGGAAAWIMVLEFAYMNILAGDSDMNSAVVISGQLLCTVGLASVMGLRAMSSGKFMPAGLVASLSAAMTVVFALRMMFPATITAVKRD